MSKTDSVNSSIDVIGADANNLKNVDVVFPLKRISVVTGVSGSGKSSLLIDTLAAEGSRRMRIFLGTSQQEVERDDVRAFGSEQESDGRPIWREFCRLGLPDKNDGFPQSGNG
jgi:ABC-type lipoprotein export system ATPase subunit